MAISLFTGTIGGPVKCRLERFLVTMGKVAYL